MLPVERAPVSSRPAAGISLPTLFTFALFCFLCIHYHHLPYQQDRMIKSSLSNVKRHFSSTKSYKVVIAGAGTAGLSIASKLSRVLPSGSTGIIETRDQHHNQALWTLVGGGVKKLQQTRSPTETLIPKGVTWIHESIASFEPDNNCLTLKSGEKVSLFISHAGFIF